MDIALTTRVPPRCRSRIFSPSSLRIASRSGVREILSCRERWVSRMTSLGLSSRERSMPTTFAYAMSESDRPSGGCAGAAPVLVDFRVARRSGNFCSSRRFVLRVSFPNISPAHGGVTSAFRGRLSIHHTTTTRSCNSARAMVYTVDSLRVLLVYRVKPGNRNKVFTW